MIPVSFRSIHGSLFVTSVLINLITVIEQLLTLLILVHVILSYFMHPYHPVRQSIDRIVEPLLAPIRQVLPPVGMFDFSPLVLLILVQFIGSFLIQVLR
ncbi:MAG: YggT family protein [Anaerolineae bacterium]|nr:MAG: YggT family protein [Anaerolineae bacterium]